MENVFLGQFYSPSFAFPKTMRRLADKVHSEGYDLELPCKATGMQPITYRWFVNEKKFKRKFRINVKDTGALLKIQRLRARDSAVYTCIASNRYGNLSFSYPLKIRGKLIQIMYRKLCLCTTCKRAILNNFKLCMISQYTCLYSNIY